MHKGYGRNEYGTKISIHQCDVCGEEYTQCPAQVKDEPCAMPHCESYDESRDVMKMLENEEVTLHKETIQ